jgi:hypothetical protein
MGCVMRHVLLIASLTMLAGHSSMAWANDADKVALPEPVAVSDLAEMSGGASPTGIAVTTQDLSASNSDNSLTANSIVTGNISLPAGAFNGYNGVGNFVFNTGNNNNVQGSLSITIVTPAN